MSTPPETLTPFPHNHERCIDKAIYMAEQVCLSHGARLTPTRRKILELIWESHRAVKAYDLLDRIRPFDQTAKPTTVYRALDFLLLHGLIHRVESLNAFIGCNCSAQKHEQVLLICESCQEVEERPGTAVMEAVGEELREAGFTMHHKAIEIHGICAHCLTAAAPEDYTSDPG